MLIVSHRTHSRRVTASRLAALTTSFMALVFAAATVSPALADQKTIANLPTPVTENLYHPYDENRALLGQKLFFDPLLSGNQNISCATCHHPDLASGDGLPLGIGEGGAGIGKNRTIGSGRDLIRRRVPRNSPALFNLGALEFSSLFHDGRVEIDEKDPSGFDTPADEDTPTGLMTILAAQALFPLTSGIEMAGQGTENDIGQALEDIYGNPWKGVWAKVEQRLRQSEPYLPLFQDAFPEIQSAKDITIVHYANAVGDFVNAEWRSSQSPFDRYMAGEQQALTEQQKIGLDLFYGRANCASCHSGPFLTDQKFHAIAMPQIGPGRVARLEAIRHDRGRAGATNLIEDRYKFRTPSLRNVALTEPYGHSGAYATLEGVVRHHLDPVSSFERFSLRSVALPQHPRLSNEDGFIMQDRRERRRILAANVLKPISLKDEEVDALIAFLQALTDTSATSGRLGIPVSVPSGLPID
ncbi:cytochrome-c peroxidase [Pararhizobium sp. IMCC21322]|uniref:cytochrome-c peroxidase n=1 Tax=Pararhizobium sp. IMCC21322 TaxID=3067903 RepID=UPI00274159FE|nr:cytochrome c peroxidase [Pararhizobium sp. IMCC21322]